MNASFPLILMAWFDISSAIVTIHTSPSLLPLDPLELFSWRTLGFPAQFSANRLGYIFRTFPNSFYIL